MGLSKIAERLIKQNGVQVGFSASTPWFFLFNFLNVEGDTKCEQNLRWVNKNESPTLPLPKLRQVSFDASFQN